MIAARSTDYSGVPPPCFAHTMQSLICFCVGNILAVTYTTKTALAAMPLLLDLQCILRCPYVHIWTDVAFCIV